MGGGDNLTSIGNIFKTKLSKVSDDGDLRTVNADGFVMMINNLEGTFRVKTEPFAKVKFKFLIPTTGNYVETELLTASDIGDSTFRLPEEVKKYLSEDYNDNLNSDPNGFASKLGFTAVVQDSGNNVKEFPSGLFYATRATASTPGLNFGSDFELHDVPAGMKQGTPISSNFSPLPTSDWGVQDDSKTADINPKIFLSVDNIYMGSLEHDGFTINAVDGLFGTYNSFKGDDNPINNAFLNGNDNVLKETYTNLYKEYQAAKAAEPGTPEAARASEILERLTTFKKMYIEVDAPELRENHHFTEKWTRVKAKDAFGNTIGNGDLLNKLKVYTAEVRGSFRFKQEEDGIPFYTGNTNPELVFTINRDVDGRVNDGDYRRVAWLKVSINSGAEKYLSFPANSSYLELRASEIDPRAFISGINTVRYTLIDAWGNETSYTQNVNVNTSTVNLHTDSNSGSKADNITNIASPKLVLFTANKDEVTETLFYINYKVYKGHKTAPNRWELDLSGATEVVLSDTNDPNSRVEREIPNQVIRLNDGQYFYRVAVVTPNNLSYSSNTLVVDTTVPTADIMKLNAHNTPNPYLENVYHSRGGVSTKLMFKVPEDISNFVLTFPEKFGLEPLTPSAINNNTADLGWFNFATLPEEVKADGYFEAEYTVTDIAGNTKTGVVKIFFNSTLPEGVLSFGSDLRPIVPADAPEEVKQRVINNNIIWDAQHLKFSAMNDTANIVKPGETSALVNLYGYPGSTIIITERLTANGEPTKNPLVKLVEDNGAPLRYTFIKDRHYTIKYISPSSLENDPLQSNTNYNYNFVVNAISDVEVPLTIELANKTGVYDMANEDETDDIDSTNTLHPVMSGTSSPGSLITLMFNNNGQEYTTRTDYNGKWKYVYPKHYPNLLVGVNDVTVHSTSLLGIVSETKEKPIYLDLRELNFTSAFIADGTLDAVNYFVSKSLKTDDNGTFYLKGSIDVTSVEKITISIEGLGVLNNVNNSNVIAYIKKDDAGVWKVYTTNADGETLLANAEMTVNANARTYTAKIKLSDEIAAILEAHKLSELKVSAESKTGITKSIDLNLYVDTNPPPEASDVQLMVDIAEDGFGDYRSFYDADNNKVPVTTNINFFRFIGRAEANAKVKLNIAERDYFTYADTNGRWLITLDENSLTEKVHDVTIQVTDLAGNKSAESVYQLNYTDSTLNIEYKFTNSILPEALNPDDIMYVGKETPIHIEGKITDGSGNLVAGATVTLNFNGIVKTVTTGLTGDELGKYSFDTSTDPDIINFLGETSFHIQAVKDNYKSLTLVTNILRTNTTVFTADLDDSSDDGYLGDNITTINSPTEIKISGIHSTTVANLKITITYNDEVVLNQLPVTLNPDGRWEYDFTSVASLLGRDTLPVGIYKYTINAEKSADTKYATLNNNPVSGAFQIADVGDIISKVNIVDSRIKDVHANTDGNDVTPLYAVENKTTASLSGYVSNGAKVRVNIYKKNEETGEFEQEEFLGFTPTVRGDGQWKNNINYEESGIYRAEIIVNDDEANKKNVDFILLDYPPKGTTIGLTLDSDLGVSDKDHVTSLQYTPKLTGNASEGSIIRVKNIDQNKYYYTRAGKDGVWVITGIDFKISANTFEVTTTNVFGYSTNKLRIWNETTKTYDEPANNRYVFTIDENVPIINEYAFVPGASAAEDKFVVKANSTGIVFVKVFTRNEDGTMDKIVYLNSLPSESETRISENGIQGFQYEGVFNREELGLSDKTVYAEIYMSSKAGKYSVTTQVLTIYGFNVDVQDSTVYNELNYVKETNATLTGIAQPNSNLSLILISKTGESVIELLTDPNGKWTHNFEGLQNNETYEYRVTSEDTGTTRSGSFKVQAVKNIDITNFNFIEAGKTSIDHSTENTTGGVNVFAEQVAVVRGRIKDAGSDEYIASIVTITITNEDGKVSKFVVNTDENGNFTAIISDIGKLGVYRYSVSAQSYSGADVQNTIDGIITVQTVSAGELTVDTITNNIPNSEDFFYTFSGTITTTSDLVFTIFDAAQNNVIYSLKQIITGAQEDAETNTWKIKIPKSVFPYGMTNFKYEAYVIGKESEKITANFNINSTKFKLYSTVEQEPVTLDGIEDKFIPTPGYVNISTPTFKGYAAPDATVTLTLMRDGMPAITQTTTANSLGEWSIVSERLTDARYRYTISQEGHGADASSLITGNLVVSTTPPLSIVSDVLRTVGGQPGLIGELNITVSDGETQDSTPTVYGKVSAGYNAIIEFQDIKYFIFTNPDGTFIYNLSNTPLSNGAYEYKAYAVTPSGVVSDPAPHRFVVNTDAEDTTPPEISSQDNDNREHYVYNLDNPSKLTIKGFVDEASTVTVKVFNENNVIIFNQVITVDTQLGVDSPWSAQFNGLSLKTETTYRFEVTAVDMNGNTAAPKKGTFVIPITSSVVSDEASTSVDIDPTPMDTDTSSDLFIDDFGS